MRRSIQGSVRYSAKASQIIQSEAKGRTLHPSVILLSTELEEVTKYQLQAHG